MTTLPRLSTLFADPALRAIFARAERDLPPEASAVETSPVRPLPPQAAAAKRELEPA
jgi:hypothetical protein